ncbi:hypothetical protein GCM10027084_01460 [Pseudoxanthomonas sangjuensis]|uniref:ArnT family glycosyltransferase n=1 Tax=Pseudoxanthomonas sangjuensis TaxID=1503750 RepID=UPI0013910475|nr:hypothetical protein [Pseudoxanthomonas sangjuensis]
MRVMLRWFALACLVSFLLCSSVFFFGGDKVDESEIVLNALTIASGDWNPVWSPGYGHLAMYLPALAIWLIALGMQASGMAGSHTDALYLLFSDGAAYRIVRFVYTLADVGTSLVFARIIWNLSRKKLLVASFLVYVLVSPDTWFYANYIRTDTLVSFFSACAVLVLVRSHTRLKPYLLGLSLGAAIACKYSAVVYVALIALLLLPYGDNPRRFPDRLRVTMVAAVMTVAATFVFQPLYDYSGIVAAIHTHLSGSHFTKEIVPLADRWARLWSLILKLEPLAALMLVAMLGGLIQLRKTAPLLLAVVLGIAPFALSNFSREYWLLPFADALRAAAWVGASCLVLSLGRRFGATALRTSLGIVSLAVLALAIARFSSLASSHAVPQDGLSNEEAARRWLYLHIANRKPLIYAYEKNYQLPRAYSFANYDDAAIFSRVFIFRRTKFAPLHEMFHRELYGHDYAEFSSLAEIPQLRLSVGADSGSVVPKLCAGKRCFSAKSIDCSEKSRARFSSCIAFAWDMDRPELREDLSQISLMLAPQVTDFTTCWYDCDNPDAEVPLYRKHNGSVALLGIADRLFARAQVVPLKKVARMDTRGEEVFLVTTPDAYRSWLPKQVQGKEKDVAAFFAKTIDARLVQYFDAGKGPRIEVYALRPSARK